MSVAAKGVVRPFDIPKGGCQTIVLEVGSWCANVDCWTYEFAAPAQGETRSETLKCCYNADGVVTSVVIVGGNCTDAPIHGTGYPYGCCSQVVNPPSCPSANAANCPPYNGGN